jgi:hypothetical protein
LESYSRKNEKSIFLNLVLPGSLFQEERNANPFPLRSNLLRDCLLVAAEEEWSSRVAA